MLNVSLQHTFGGFDLDVALQAGPGITALFGRSGAGKTTVINAVAGLLKPDAGKISFGDAVLCDMARGIHLPPYQRQFGYVFQDARLFPHMNVRENLTFGQRYQSGQRTGPDFNDIVDLLGLAPLLDRRAPALSAGEKQRVALGRALLCRPRMLLMDEPLANLDAPRKQEILPYLEQLRDGPIRLPILYVSHAVDEVARLADTLVLMQDGRITRSGALFDVLADPAVIPTLGVREAGAVIEADVLDHADDGLSTLKTSAGLLELPGVRAPKGTRVRLRVLAQDVIISRDKPDGLSSANILPVTVQEVHPGEGPGAAVALQSGDDRLLARVTARAVQQLRLKPGLRCYAILSATTIAPGDIGGSSA